MKRNFSFILLLMASLLIFSCNQGEKQGSVAETSKASVLTAAAEDYFANYPGSRIVPADKVFAAMDANEDFLLLDIRRADAYAEGHLKGAVNAPWGPAIADALDWLPHDKPVYVNCYTGQTAGQAVAALNVAGIQALSIKSGWNLGISKTDGYEAYVDTETVLSPDATGEKYDDEIRSGVEAFFNAIPETGNNIIASADLKAKMDVEEPMTIISIRQPDVYDQGHIEGAINIPFGKGIQTQFSQLPKDEPVYVYCYTGQTAGQTVGILRLLGYNAISVKSGMGTAATAGTGWGVEGFPVVQ